MTDPASGSLFVLHDHASRVTEVRSELYDSEEALQLLLASHPELLTAHTSGATTPRRWILVSREQGVPDAPGAANRWALDHLFLYQDAVPTLVGVKRASDTRARREVVAPSPALHPGPRDLTGHGEPRLKHGSMPRRGTRTERPCS